MEMRRCEMEASERLLGMVVLMPWRRTEAVTLRHRGVCGFVQGILELFGENGPPDGGEGVRASWRIKAVLENSILHTQIMTCSLEIFSGYL